MAFSLKHHASGGDVTHTLAEWGISNVVATGGGWSPGKLSFDIAGQFDAESPFEYGDRVTLLEGSTVRWTGRIRELPQIAKGASETRSFVAEDVIGDLARRSFRQVWNVMTGSGLSEELQAAFVLFRNVANSTVSIASQLTAITNGAIAVGIEVQMGTAASMTASPHAVDGQMTTYLAALQRCAQFAPDLVPQVDHTTTPPTLHFIRRVDATERSIDLTVGVEEFSAQPLKDQQISAAHLTYLRPDTSSGLLYVAAQDIAPEGATGNEENALVVTQTLAAAGVPRPGSKQVQAIETTGIDAGSFDFWEMLWPEIADRESGATLEDDDIVGPPAVTKMILSGAQPAWTGSAATVTVVATFNGTINGNLYVSKKLVARVNASTLATGTYEQSIDSGDAPAPGDSPPTGLAALLYGALSPLQYAGTIARVSNELSWTVKPGNTLNFTGSDDSALDTARASVQSVQRELQTGRETITFGPVPTLSFNDLLDLLKLQQPAQPSLAYLRAGEAAGGLQVEGAGMGPGSSLVPTADVDLHPFAVVKVDEGTFIVIPGSVNSVIPTIGGTSIAVDPAPELSVSTTGSRVAVLNINATLTVVDDVYVSTAVLTTVTITVETTNPGPAGLLSSTGAFKVPLATFVDGEKTSQLRRESLSVMIVDDGTETGTAELFIVGKET